ncbi:PROTEIN ROOT HAIR DEFECTIVE 3-like protein [Salix viminalis]|uniref:PROTEIN ROOT HAIR DEFECTIVE 3-like protein n=1 Tax=Salix viminalis TaxID=40686 RepID=A0A9Q0NUV5_SALVM|nr:PROTEIN ROOT HAIR DEFECTIVE 3-like protein [Salix viminalis]
MLGHLRSKALESFKTRLEQSMQKGEGFADSVRACAQSCLAEFDKGCEASVRSTKLTEMIAKYEKQLIDVLADEVQSLFEAGETDTWLSVRNLLESKTKIAISEISNVVVGLKLHKSEIDTKLEHLRENARNVVKRKAREAAAAERVLTRMKDRFTQVFNPDENSKPRIWTREKNIDEIERNALSASLKILSTMAAIRLDKMTDEIEHLLFSSLMDESGDIPSSQRTGITPDPLASNTWEEVSPNDTLLTPMKCKSLWMEFKEDMKYTVNQARSHQEALRIVRRKIKIVVRDSGGSSDHSSGATSSHEDSCKAGGGSNFESSMEVLPVLRDLGMEVVEMLKETVLMALRSLQPEMVGTVIALVATPSISRQQY